MQVFEYPFSLLRDAASTLIKLNKENSLRQPRGLVYYKAYNSNKDLFATLLKGYNAFDNTSFKVLGYSNRLINRWIDLNRRWGRT